ncbi:hypothetical protein ABL78_0396 [Leptomonas seymouri]|uniref:Uncharacterized protein n=1 Tax=Leptomonas seymouri TaxID=5684 RepID=A0A0N0P8X8_LEPSE|nr:hypothetical protein ABL78_0396 [Leptomonas seymouri]|eukprot:KPI90466.1 hypothetical protein ABL78_0396 [Leptomonas seymouri]
MNSSSLFLSPSPSTYREVAAPHPAPSPMLMDVVPFEAALQRLLYEKVRTDEQLSGYGVQQAYRGLLYAVRAGTLLLNGVNTGNTSTHPSACALGDSAPHITIDHGSVSASSLAAGKERGDVASTCAVRGWQAVVYRLSLAAVRSAEDLECAVFLSVRILCDPASAYGEGNDRPCCTAEWTQALLFGLPLDASTASHGSPDARFCHLVQANRRYQLGYLLILSNTLRMVATGRVREQHLCSNYPELFQGMATMFIPRAAQYVEELLRNPEEIASLLPSATVTEVGSTPPPNRLSVELNHFVIHSSHWLTMDALSAHMDADDKDAQQARAGEQLVAGKAKKRPLVLDRDQPACIWGCVTLLRNALRRALGWIKEEAERAGEKAVRNAERAAQGARSQSVALLDEVIEQLNGIFTDLLKKQEFLQNALMNASREFNGVVTRDVRALTEMVWAHTLQMCFLLRNVTGVWVSVHGGLGYSDLCADQLLPAYKDVLMFMTSSLLRIPSLETKKEEEREVFLASDAALCAVLTLVSAAPTSTLQTDLWASDHTVTQQVHALLVQRALRYRNGQVLKFASLLSRAVLDAAVQDGALAGFATSSADQLLELLDSEGDDAASRCVGELLTVAILQRPYRLIPALFRLLQHGSVAARRRVLQVLSNLPDFLSDTASPCSSVEGELYTLEAHRQVASTARTSDDRRRDVLRLLAENLLLQLQDEELCLRMLGSSLFAKVHPCDVVLPLLNLCVQRDTTGRKQSAGLAALTNVLTAHTDDAGTYMFLLHSAYQCHSSTKANSAGSAELQSPASALVQAAEETDLSPAGSLVRRPVPQTPGDILSQSLLYSSTTDPAEADDACGDAEEAPKDERKSSEAAQPVDAASSSSPPSHARHREARLHSALLTLTDKWVHAALPKWTLESHSHPLVQCLAHQAFGSASPGVPSTPAADVEDRVQFFMKYILRSTGVITGATVGAEETASVSAAKLAAARASHLLAIWSVFFAERVGVPDKPEEVNKWSAVIECGEGELNSVTPGSAQAKARVHAVLLPLLCLRSCEHSVFARAPLLRAVKHFSSMACSEPQSEVTLATSEVAEALKADAASAAVENACDQVVSSIWRTLWSAVARSGSTNAFFALYPDIQRVVLEVLCRFPAAVFFTQWEHWKKAVITDEESGNSSRGFALTVESLFAYRVYVYGVSAYLAAASSGGRSSHSAQTPPMDLDVVLQHRHTLVRLLSTVLPQWLMEEDEERTRVNESAESSTEAVKRRLFMAAADAGGVLGVVALAYPLQATINSHEAPYIEVDQVKQDLLSTCEELFRDPILHLALAYRSTEAEGGSSDSNVGADVPAASEPPSVLLLTRFQICLRMHACLLRAITVYPQGRKEVLLQWFRHFLRHFMELSNAACKSAVGKAAHECRAAVDACGLLFQAVMASHKADAATAKPAARPSDSSAAAAATQSTVASPSAKATSSPTLCRLAWEEKDALVSFSLGCTRFAAFPVVQTVGVRLLSSLIAAAPEIFLEVGTPAGGMCGAVPGPTTAAGGDALQVAATALHSIAMMHSDRPTRLLAEEVLRMLEKAYSANEVAS